MSRCGIGIVGEGGVDISRQMVEALRSFFLERKKRTEVLTVRAFYSMWPLQLAPPCNSVYCLIDTDNFWRGNLSSLLEEVTELT